MVTFNNATALSPDLQAYFKKETGVDYTHIIESHSHDGVIGLVSSDKRVDFLQFQEDGFTICSSNYLEANLTRFDQGTDVKCRFFNPDNKYTEQLKQYDTRKSDGSITIVNADIGDPRIAKSVQMFTDAMPAPLRSSLLYIDMAPAIFTHFAFPSLGMTHIGSRMCAGIGFHEVAHLHTANLESQGKDILQEWTAIQNGSDGDKEWKGQDFWFGKLKCCIDEIVDNADLGFVSSYAMSSADEDISETTGWIFDQIERVREGVGKSAILRQKVEFLKKYGYIREDQYDYLIGRTKEPPPSLPTYCDGMDTL